LRRVLTVQKFDAVGTHLHTIHVSGTEIQGIVFDLVFEESPNDFDGIQRRAGGLVLTECG
jgi:hypothetical protein